jgi:hypothetical protein
VGFALTSPAFAPSFRANFIETAAHARPFDILAVSGRANIEIGHESS